MFGKGRTLLTLSFCITTLMAIGIPGGMNGAKQTYGVEIIMSLSLWPTTGMGMLII
jgi:hypothetical protein